MNSRSPPERVVLSDEIIDGLRSVTTGGYYVRDLIDPSLYVAVTARGRRRFYVTVALGDWPELTVDKARNVVARIGELVSSARLIKRPVRRDEEVMEVDMAAE